MRKNKIILLFLAVGFLTAIALGLVIYFSNSNELKITFLDVGQGDAILISQGSDQILIDGGPNGDVLLDKLGKYMPFWDRKIELVLATHPDQDHIEGLIEAMKYYAVGVVADNSFESETQVYKKYKDIIQEKNIKKINARKNLDIKLGNGGGIKILSPREDAVLTEKDTNGGSIVAKLTYGNGSFLLTGDLPAEIEDKLVAENADLKSNVLKVAHHGSKYSTGEEFLGKVDSKVAIISVGKNNRFGHPAPETLSRLENKHIKIIRTDQTGDISYLCKKEIQNCQLVAN